MNGIDDDWYLIVEDAPLDDTPPLYTLCEGAVSSMGFGSGIYKVLGDHAVIEFEPCTQRRDRRSSLSFLRTLARIRA